MSFPTQETNDLLANVVGKVVKSARVIERDGDERGFRHEIEIVTTDGTIVRLETVDDYDKLSYLQPLERRDA